MKEAKILVTGASGFLGCRLVERLLIERNVSVRAMAHRPGQASRLARLPVEIIWSDITDQTQAAKAVEGCDFVVHCAYGAGGSRSQNKKVTVKGTRILAECAADAGVRRFIHISTVAIYSYSPPDSVTETSPFVRSGDPYCDNKIEAEEAIWNIMKKQGLPATILRTGNIYGPFSGPWTLQPLSHIREGIVSVVDGGHHLSNMVFVDNAVEAILLSIRKEKVIGEAFFVIDDEITWIALYQHYAEWLGTKSLGSISSKEVRNLVKPSFLTKLQLVGSDLWGNVFIPILRYSAFRVAESVFLGPFASGLWQSIPMSIREKFLGNQIEGEQPLPAKGEAISSNGKNLPPLGLLEVYSGRGVFSNRKAKEILGYGPFVSFPEALKITKTWAKWARLI